MTTPWGFEDFDAHEDLHFVTNEACGLKAIIAVHSTHLGPAAGGCRYWRYDDDADALKDALRLSRGMSYKNAMAGLAMGGGKAVILAGPDRSKTPAMLEAFGRAVERLGGAYVTAEDVGVSVADMVAIRGQTRYVAGLPVAPPLAKTVPVRVRLDADAGARLRVRSGTTPIPDAATQLAHSLVNSWRPCAAASRSSVADDWRMDGGTNEVAGRAPAWANRPAR